MEGQLRRGQAQMGLSRNQNQKSKLWKRRSQLKTASNGSKHPWGLERRQQQMHAQQEAEHRVALSPLFYIVLGLWSGINSSLTIIDLDIFNVLFALGNESVAAREIHLTLMKNNMIRHAMFYL